jgi:hypothetical protein
VVGAHVETGVGRQVVALVEIAAATLTSTFLDQSMTATPGRGCLLRAATWDLSADMGVLGRQRMAAKRTSSTGLSRFAINSSHLLVEQQLQLIDCKALEAIVRVVAGLPGSRHCRIEFGDRVYAVALRGVGRESGT